MRRTQWFTMPPLYAHDVVRRVDTLYPPHRPRMHLRGETLPRPCGGRRGLAQHEPQSEWLRQRGGREHLSDHQGRRDRTDGSQNHRLRMRTRVLVYRGVLQRKKGSIRLWAIEPHSRWRKRSWTSCQETCKLTARDRPLNRGKLIAPLGCDVRGATPRGGLRRCSARSSGRRFRWRLQA